MLKVIDDPLLLYSEVRAFLLRQINLLSGSSAMPDGQMTLIELGIDSVRLLSLLEALRRQGVALGFIEVMENPTLQALEQLIVASLNGQHSPWR